MPLTFKARAGSGDFTPIPSGSHVAICDIVADLGLQPGSALYPAPKQQVYIRFQIPAERVQFEKDGKKIDGPAVIGQAFTASMNEKATLRKHLQGWRGKQFTDEEAEKFDVAGVLGKGCMLSVVHNVKGDKVYANIGSISALPKGVKAPIPESEPLYYAKDDMRCYAQLPEWLRTKIDNQLLKQPQPNPAAASGPDGWDGGDPGITDDDIPF
jgi:hypothetical protein